MQLFAPSPLPAPGNTWIRDMDNLYNMDMDNMYVMCPLYINPFPFWVPFKGTGAFHADARLRARRRP